MDHTAFALEPYLKRLHYSGSIQPTEDGLEALHRAQAYTIPFENFNILLGRGITLEPAMIYNKLGGPPGRTENISQKVKKNATLL